MSQWTGRLKLDEKRRNARGSILVYRFDRSLDYEYPAVHHYDTMDHCKAKITEHPFNKWAISKQDVKHGKTGYNSQQHEAKKLQKLVLHA